ncbi:hypothetical protein [Candidatus Mesenet endosymbiont of Agriotes lineatus]|uniref:hypothetical protein n=1 Tax=Candidatus Mesenet endosymbiont of Agriotes lineatus TaxID=3077948 RepID=UPI0030D38CDA
MVFNNKEVFNGQKYLNLEEPKGNTFIRCNQYMVQTQLEAAVVGINKLSVSVFSKDGNINQLTMNGRTLLEEVFILWFNGMYGLINNLINFIEYINFLINQNARFTDELNIQVQQDVSKEVSDFVEPINSGKYTIIAHKKENVIFTSISNARLKMGKLLESDFCRDNCLFNSHFNINGNKGYAQKNCNTGMRNYVVYRGCIAMRISWSVVSFDKNSSQIVKKENINIYIKDNGTVHVNEQDESRYKNREINFDGCCVLIGDIPLKDALNKGRWLYSNNQTFCDSGYCETSSEGKTSIFNSNNDLVNLDTCKVNQENNENLLMKDTDIEQNQLLDSESDSLTYMSESSKIDVAINEILQDLQSIDLDENNVAKIEEKNRKVEEENKIYFRELNSNKLYAQFSKEKRCTHQQQMTIACGISVDNSQTSFEHSDQNNNVTASNTGSFIDDQYYEKMNINSRDFTICGTPNAKEKVAVWLDNPQNGHNLTGSLCNNNSHSGKGSFNSAVSNTTSSPNEPDRSSTNDLSWDNNTLDLNDTELDCGPPRRTRSFNSERRSSSVPTRLGTLRELLDNSQNCNFNESFARPTIRVTSPKAERDISSELDTLCEVPNNNPSYNLNEFCIYSIVQDPNKKITKFGVFFDMRS